MTAAADARATARQARNSDWVDRAARLGLVLYGVVHLVIAALAVQLALGDRSEAPSGSGAMEAVAEQLFGRAALWLIAFGMLLLVVWSAIELVAGHRGEDGAELWRHRATDVGKASGWVVLGITAATTATGPLRSNGGGGGEEALTARIMNLPGGQLLVGLVALVILAVAADHVRKGVSGKHAEKLATEGRTGDAGRAYLLVGKVGYIGKGIAIGLVGVLFAVAAATHESGQSGGLDDGLASLLDLPYGPWLLLAVALGIGCFGLFCFARARHLSR
ncbi:DUF1206 domain-containing protein [Nocardioides sp. CFH 31398]|uniref:DUF1206 domain-containing protein n=1 Tax=Nocardioides sp. CFH 31398 TaxID=2919579 RepID=UPI001F069F52|nr:DUF1206 domain-containing protein [Nocardioides sp. CFH 31398]MCH1867411.1 DUF1206 domain-containing protein [Nocardioides sp. CFH 31398]MCH1868592.1 DUF1206 domain-containing protein [Nocardioides sp. CFH 31398]